MKMQFVFGLCLISLLFAGCDMTTSDRIEGVWTARAANYSIFYEETYVLNKGGAYTYERKRDGKSVYNEEGSWATEKQKIGDYEDDQRVVVLTPAKPKDVKQYVLLYSLENNGYTLILGSYNSETNMVDKQRFDKKAGGSK